MVPLILMAYFGIGLLAAGFTVAIFPPRPGYRPPLSTCVLALTTFTAFWPLLVMMAMGYWFGRFYRRWSGEEPAVCVVRAPRFRYRVMYDELQVRN
jgi:hypothetical protein